MLLSVLLMISLTFMSTWRRLFAPTMPPKKAAETDPSKTEDGKPDEAALLFAFECLKAFGEDGMVSTDIISLFLDSLLILSQLDISALSKSMGHTNAKSTRNAFMRHKNKWGFKNIPCTSGKAGDGAPVDGSGKVSLLVGDHVTRPGS